MICRGADEEERMDISEEQNQKMTTSSQTINYSSDDDDVPFDLLLIIYYHFLRRCIINIILCVVYFLCHIKSADIYIYIKENISPVFSSSAIYSIKYTLSPTSPYFHRFKITTVSSSSSPYQDSLSYYTTTTVAALIIAADVANHLYPSCGRQCLKAIDKHILHNSLFNSDLYCHSLLWSPTNNRPERISVIYI